MRRFDIPEIEDYGWCPRPARDAATAFLALLAEVARPYDALAPRLALAVRQSGAHRVVDLASGAGGPWRALQPLMAANGADVEVLLTDRYPPRDLRLPPGGRVRYLPDAVDATAVPAELDGFRTICGAFHHFSPAAARALLEDAARRGQGVAVLEAVQRRLTFMALAALLPVPYLAMAPALKRSGWATFVWSYLIPLAPSLLAVDGVASCLRAYTATEMAGLAEGLDSHVWEAGELRGSRVPVSVSYLIGVPRRAASAASRTDQA